MSHLTTTQFLQEGDDSNSSGAKFVVDGGYLSSTGTTAGWLENVTALSLIDPTKAIGMSHKKLLQGVLKVQPTGKVVVKIADKVEDIMTEWTTFEVLSKQTLMGFAKYLGAFKCDDSLARVLESGTGDRGLCQGPGDTMQVLIMEYIDGPSMKRADWRSRDILTIQSCIVQAIATALEAFLACGFVHGDLHLDNVLLAPNVSPAVDFVKFQRVGLGVRAGAFLTRTMDLELSRTGGSVTAFFKDMRTFFSKAVSDLLWCVDVSPLQACYRRVDRWIDDGARDPRVVTELIGLIATLDFAVGGTAVHHPSPPRGGGRGKPRLNKRRGVW